MISQLASRIRSFRNRQRIINELASLDDRQLADIGVSRGDIKRAVTFGRF
ncbi:DUF1127 domain-containing protein [Aureimonas altamirensis]|nr:DUF1127 domain-containing protein [Aureimonas altamirensis]UHD46099.1 DUF1127 domain-containing protein [Aureimonas altamirensis]